MLHLFSCHRQARKVILPVAADPAGRAALWDDPLASSIATSFASRRARVSGFLASWSW
jgi:hypothetical protein